MQITIQRFSVISSRPYQEIIADFEAAIGHPEMYAFQKNMSAAKDPLELGAVVNAATGPSGLMEFAPFNLGEVVSKEPGAEPRRSLRFVEGNPVIMWQTVKHGPDAGSYAQ